VPLLDALRALTRFDPPPVLPDCDFSLLGDLLEAHGLAALASYQLESTRLGGTVPDSLRERLLASYQGVANDNVLKLVALRGVLRELDLPVVLLEGAAYVDWLYPHLAFRPIGDVRAAVAAQDGERFAEQTRGALELVRTEHHARSAVFTNGTLTLSLQEGLWPGAAADPPLFERSRPHRAFGPTVARPSPEDALLATIADQALLGLRAPLITYVDLRELMALPLDAELVKARAGTLGLSRALHGATLLAAHFFPESGSGAAALRPPLGFAERIAVERVVDAAKDPARLRHLRGTDAAARLVVVPRAG
jgi:hypothetical protein